MRDVLITLVNMSITAAIVALVVMLLRVILRCAPRWIVVLLWGFVALRLLLPFTVESALSLMPSAEPLPDGVFAVTSTEIINSPGIQVYPETSPGSSDSIAPPSQGGNITVTRGWLPTDIVGVVWLSGVICMLLWGAVSYLRLRRTLREAVRDERDVWLCDSVSSPFILGIIRPRIYLPSSISESDADYVISHEKAHIRRLDHIWKPLGFVLLSFHWFNPVLWFGYILLCRDIELACDQKVIGELGEEVKKPYSEVLIRSAASRRLVSACPLAFGEVAVKQRIKNVLNYKKPAFWIIIVAIILSAAAALCLLTNPPESKLDDNLQVFIENIIKSRNYDEDTKNYFSAVDIEIVKVKKTSSRIDVYMWVLYEEFDISPMLPRAESVCGSHIFTLISVAPNGSKDYRLLEYWQPEDGARYVESIKEKLPMSLWRTAMNSQKYIERQDNANQERVNKYMQLLGYTGADAQPLATAYTVTTMPNFTARVGVMTDFSKGILELDWVNDNDEMVCFGSQYTLCRDGKSIMPEQIAWTAELIGLSANGDGTMSIPLYAFIDQLKTPGEYELVKEIWLMSDPGTKYILKVIFVVAEELSESDYSYIIDTVSFDIDGDGEEEMLTLAPGPYSGRYSVRISMQKQGKTVSQIVSGSVNSYDKFIAEDGVLYVEGQQMLEGGEISTVRHKVILRDGMISIENYMY